jgi:putative flippase GtrA
MSQVTASPNEAARGFAAFLAVGLAGLATDAAVFSLLSAGGVGLVMARAVSMLAATLVTWQLNRRYTFGLSDRPALEEGARYTLVAILAQGSSYLAFVLLCRAMPWVSPLAFLVLCSGAVAVLSFLGQRLFTFRQS